MAFTINASFDIGQTIYHIAQCESGDTTFLTVLTDVVDEVATTSVDDNGTPSTTIQYLVVRETNKYYALQDDSFATLADAMTELENRLQANPQ